MAVVSRHGRPAAGNLQRPRGYPAQHVPDIPATSPKSGLMLSGRSVLFALLLVLFFILPAYI